MTTNDHTTIAQAEQQLAQAHLTLDLVTIDRLLHPDYIILQPNGELETKADVSASYQTGARRWDSAQVDQLDIRLYGNTAIAIGRWQATGQNGADYFDYTARFISTWLKQNNQWRNIAYQSAEITT